jgi:hypothetical protein
LTGALKPAMRTLTKRERLSLDALAAAMATTWRAGDGTADAVMKVGRAGLAVDIVTLKRQTLGPIGTPRLRFDRVVMRLLESLREALDPDVPTDTTVLVTVTAPIRLAARTSVSVADAVRSLLSRHGYARELRANRHGNEVRIRLVTGVSRRAPRLLGFVHNPDSDPTLLLDLACDVLSAGGRAQPARRAGARGLLLVTPDAHPPAETYRAALSCLPQIDFSRVWLIGADRAVASLSD